MTNCQLTLEQTEFVIELAKLYKELKRNWNEYSIFLKSNGGPRLPKINQYFRYVPTLKQALFLLTEHREVLFGGAAGPGKSTGLLMAALQYVNDPSYSAILFRRTYTDLTLPESLISKSHEWLSGTDARWNEMRKQWRFPSGATLNFGYIQNKGDEFRYKSAKFNFIGFDEVTDFKENQYTYLFSRLRKSIGSGLPSRMRAASNPDGRGFTWVKRRFILSKTDDRLFLPANLSDNPFIDHEDYIQSLENLDAVTKARLLKGDWNVVHEGHIFSSSGFKLCESVPVNSNTKQIRAWDLAASKPSSSYADPDYTVGAKFVMTDGVFYLTDIVRGRWEPAEVENVIKNTAKADGSSCPIVFEVEGGAAGKMLFNHYKKSLKNYSVFGVRPSGSKLDRAMLLAIYMGSGKVNFLKKRWLDDLKVEFLSFPEGDHDDQVDACSLAFNMLANKKFIKIKGASALAKVLQYR